MAIADVALSKSRVDSWRRYYELSKPRVVALILFTALVGMLLSVPGMVPWQTLVFGLLGIGLASASGAALNHVIDRRIDAVMDRTRNRPLPTGRVELRRALVFAIGIGVLAVTVLVVAVNVLTAVLTAFALIGYAVIYTVFLKRSTPQNIVWGGLAGAAPPLLGWTAVTGEIQVEPLLLVLLVFVWTPPHFWALAIKRREEYARAGIPMLPVTHGVAFTKLQVLLYTLMLLTVSLVPFIIHMTGVLYLVGALALGLGFVFHAYRLWRSSDDRYAMPTFGYSIFYLTAMFALLLVDHYARMMW
ncbi:protoheme IX farnesyltransferase [Thioalkalivibrio denitrificans]|uniref:Protoheme IX farnesyltransferase n=1 Tax=Thioalkalivibrio denitrificans TaxID=108003 RepID=A0A1V3NDB1_9GAMM|nr:heme o synthase [Thioalkalivibrio denitrificans]OOG23087.1 protoheme IX farnesyltransferase [Thioalkalivibrio denitrificans]